MFYHHKPSGYHQILPGIRIKTLAYGEKTHITEFLLTRGSQLPGHAHAQEQTGYLISGRIRLSIGAETFEMDPGDSWCVPRNTVHQATILADSVAIEVFSPPREDYLPENLSTSTTPYPERTTP